MITKEQARQLVAASVCGRPEWLPDDDEIIILDEHTIEKSWGWVFFHTSKKWYETGEIKYAIVGNSPIIVEKLTGSLIATGTAMATERYIENYERTGRPHG
jgi:Immunity protein 35